jgi:hypothetical protein
MRTWRAMARAAVRRAERHHLASVTARPTSRRIERPASGTNWRCSTRPRPGGDGSRVVSTDQGGSRGHPSQQTAISLRHDGQGEHRPNLATPRTIRTATSKGPDNASVRSRRSWRRPSECGGARVGCGGDDVLVTGDGERAVWCWPTILRRCSSPRRVWSIGCRGGGCPMLSAGWGDRGGLVAAPLG